MPLFLYAHTMRRMCLLIIHAHAPQILGIGLGARCIAKHAGVPSPTAASVSASVVELQHNASDPLWASLPAKFQVIRYESVSLGEPLVSSLDRIAWEASTGATLAIKSRSKPHWGLFFQPGAHGGEQCKELLRNFYAHTLSCRTGKPVQQHEWIRPPKPISAPCVSYFRFSLIGQGGIAAEIIDR